MLLILYIYLWIVSIRYTMRNNEKFEKLKREIIQSQLDADRMMREINDSLKPRNSKAQDIATRIWLAGKQNPLPFAGGRVDPNHVCSNDGIPMPITYCDGTTQSYEDMLQQAIDEENYLLAAKVRDIIKAKKNV